MAEIMGGGANRTSVDGRYVDSPNNTPLVDVLKAAGFLDDTGNFLSGKTPEEFFIIKPDGSTVPIKITTTPLNSNSSPGDTPIPLGTKITSIPKLETGKKYLEYKVTDLNGNEHKIPVKVADETDAKATWSEIINAAKDLGITIGNTPSGYIGAWKAGGTNLSGDTPVDPNNPITPDFAKNATYKVDNATITVTLKYPETGAIWAEIKAAAASSDPVVPIDESKLWKANGKLVSTSIKYPAGTSFTSSDNSNAATGGSPERVVENRAGRTPQVGDKLFENDNKGFVIAKEDDSKDSDVAWKLLGYVYEVEGDIVKVVSVKTGDARWARQKGAVYTGVSPVADTDKLSKFLSDAHVENGYDAWIKIGGDFAINSSGQVINKIDDSVVNSKNDVKGAWNPNATFRNYDAISWALCYPKTFTDNSIDNNTSCFEKKVVSVVTGNTVESRWYLPSVSELKKVYSAGTKLLNWTSDLQGKKFWSVELDTTVENNAKYVDFADGNFGTMNKYGKLKSDKSDDDNHPEYYDELKVLSVAQFNYTTM